MYFLFATQIKDYWIKVRLISSVREAESHLNNLAHSGKDVTLYDIDRPYRLPVFSCHVCQAKTDIASFPPLQTICESCCSKTEIGHDYEYEPSLRCKVCKYCGQHPCED